MNILMVVGKASHSMGTFVASLSGVLSIQNEDDISIIAEPTTAKHYRLQRVLPLWVIPTWKPHLIRSNLSRIKKARAAIAAADVVHAHGRSAAIYVMLLTAFMPSRPPVLVSLYELADERQDTLASKLFFRWLGTKASRLTGSSLNLAATIDAQTSTDASVSFLVSPRVEKLRANPLSNRRQRVERWAQLAQSERLKNRGQLVLVVGSVEAEKRLDLFVKAMEKVTYPATAVVVGDGNPQLLAQLRSQGTDAQVSFLGWRKNLDVWYEAASVLVVTSQWESLGFVAQEAMSQGLPVVAEPVGRLRDILMSTRDATELARGDSVNLPPESGVGGLLVHAANVEETAAAITRLLSEPELWYEKQAEARQRSWDWPTIADISRKWLQYYRQAIANTTKSRRVLESQPAPHEPDLSPVNPAKVGM
ncbi:glycosyltransferase, group 1 family protein [Mobiluncus mulieris ATCC 35239]|uniref:Glycosyltransferase, group 1 family protein n=1 Tax=Mobiluncus mulieris ATCC 35239 TaxID=871571 RepID=E0QS48_9ACTO|nr:glycosyltransferase family 4 protein [Mobiluncus mulieris]EEJ53964.1 glycosyltransferase, group 1 family protein [Mobiluncus mulieris ATCC 35243]EFM45624.1 glycosyltransferase, group 1 family protein [Mobiluncus mulieris ATCC 35239]MCU9994799.1 glycosyltransferase family 4 protein [Mobiluncus mulieris]MCV0014649.1 glycosyltransferase family 4 protein [Mobiluncus mulieris]NMW82005.1 glycosyltransferase family 4 protein [Mobiluncus mulieris]